MDQSQSQTAFPIWAIVIIAIVAVVLIALSVFCVKRRRSRSLSVDTTHKQDEKKSLQTSIAQNQKLSNPKSEASLPPTQTIKKTTTTTTTTTTVTPQHNEKTDKVASNIDESDYPPPEPAQEIKFSLPLPPPSTSFFSDKMELGGDITQDFYDIYLSNKKKQGNDFVSIDVDTPSFYANVQQKAATIKSTLRQSMRVKQKANKNSAQQLFSDDNQTRKSGDGSSVIVPLKEDSSKVIIDMDPPPSLEAARPSPPPPPTQIPEINIITHSTTSPSVHSDYDGSPITPNPNLQEPVKAAKRVIRSASKKTKTRSMAVADPSDLPEENDDSSLGKISRHSSLRYASIRGSKNNGEHMTLTSGSMRRLVRESVLFDEDVLPVPSSATAAVTTLSSTASSAKKSVVDIADWWEAPKTTVDTQNVNENHLPLNITSGLDSTSSNNAPTQYRASLSASIFAGTISKASGSNASLLSDAKDDSASSSNGGVSRHSSFRRGTLGRNTLRTITASATSGMNRSLKGLFDYSSSTSSSNKIVPDDSQKMELDSEPTCELVTDERAAVADQAYSSNRQQTIPASTSSNLRSAVPISYLKPSESSTKYALADDEEFDDEAYSASKTTDMAQHESSASHKEISPADSNKIEAAPSSITALAENNFADDSTPSSPVYPSAHKGEVDTIRRMLQDTWITNMKESASNYSMLSEAESVATTSTQSTFSSKIPPRQQQSLLSKSLLTQQVAKRASLVARHNGEEEFYPIQGPEPSASFSSSTVKTMVATNEPAAISSEPIAIRQNAINKANGSNKVQESSFEDKTVVTSRFSTSPMTIASAVSSPRNSSADSSRGHSRKSSAGNSTATALRISSGYSANAKTWNGRAHRKTSKASVTPQEIISPGDSVGRSNSVNKKFFSTMRKGQKTRGNIPWMMMEEELTEKTPAQIERDRYLESGNNL
ncbi:hypothetical protein [Parasitella parasitica]|uniref:Uncharacterized protein n=1 Tax=Parasitella parasitica TaxID=35722 RepID=A0A0B7NVL8_9FUNG|nr:hypothetical protein [Parasitella parasitica]